MIIETDDEREWWKIQRAKKGIGLSNSGIAEFVGVSYNMISMHENGKSNLDPDKEIKYRQFIEDFVKSN